MKQALANCGKPEYQYDWEPGIPLNYMTMEVACCAKNVP
nr:hypothetical protein F55C12.2 - Caenorhabditis elegans [Caenorhabditis elegans]